jgi:predicted dehydrogenase
MERVRIGLIGTSGWPSMFFMPILAGYERASLSAICGRDRTRAGEVAVKYGGPQVYTDYR